MLHGKQKHLDGYIYIGLSKIQNPGSLVSFSFLFRSLVLKTIHEVFVLDSIGWCWLRLQLLHCESELVLGAWLLEGSDGLKNHCEP